MSYSAVISKIKTFPHPNADKIQCGTVVSGETVVVDMDTYSGQLGIYFPPDGQLSDEYCRLNALYAVRGPDGKKIGGGFIDKDRRVRAQTFRGVKSHGLWLPLKSLAAYRRFMDNLQEGTSLSELNGHPLCNKYITEATKREQRVAEILTRRSWYRKLLARLGIGQWVDVDMPQHFDTPKVYTGPVCGPVKIIVTEKLHGTSHRVGKVPIITAPPVWKQILAKVWPWYKLEPNVHYQVVHGTRRMLLYPYTRKREQFRESAIPAHALTKLFPDEILYGELVGYAGDRPIMPDHDPLPSAKIKANHGDRLRYKYGLQPGECTFYVYRIVQEGRELSWEEVRDRTDDLGLYTVPHLESWTHEGHIGEIIAALNPEGTSVLDSTLPREGIVIRIEHAHSFPIWVKKKSHSFGVMEGYLKDNTDYIDTEEIA